VAISNHVENVAAQNPQSDLNRIDVVTGEGAQSDQPLEATASRSGQANVYPGVTNSVPDEASGGQTGGMSIHVQGTSAADQTLAQQISQELKTDASLASAISQVNISVTDGRVTLRGTVKNDVQKREIESAIQRATGVSSVDNQLRVSSTSEPPMTPIPQP
jgi:osmotically-inducible protein OsmY